MYVSFQRHYFVEVYEYKRSDVLIPQFSIYNMNQLLVDSPHGTLKDIDILVKLILGMSLKQHKNIIKLILQP